MNNDKSIEVINSLIEINNDRIAGYETALRETEDGDLKLTFTEFIRTSKKCKQELTTEIEKIGGTATGGTKTGGQLFRLWMDFKATLTGNDRRSILNSCEYGEDMAVSTYDKALQNNLENLTTKLQAMVTAQQALIKAEHNQIKRLCDSLQKPR